MMKIRASNLKKLTLDSLPLWFTYTIKEIFSISYNLFKLMIPIIIIVKIIEELGGIQYIGVALEPLMELVGLPASMGLVWATTMIINIYGGMIIFITMPTHDPLTIAQVTVLGGMMLLAHSLPIETRITQKAGVRVLFTLLLRIGGALLMGILLHQIYTTGDFLNYSSNAIWKPQVTTDSSLLGWLTTQLKTLGQVFLIISALVVFLKLLKLSGIEKLLSVLLKPFLKVLGLSEKTTSISIIEITLGLTYGGGLLINEAQKGEISKIDIFGSLSLLSLCHSLIEDTLLIMLMGADVTGMLYFRLLFSLVLITLVVRLVKSLKQELFEQYFIYPDSKE